MNRYLFKISVWATLLLIFPIAPISRADIVTLGTTADTTIFANNTVNSNGGGSAIFVGNNGQSSPRRGLLAFDIAGSLPTGATIQSAKLTLYVSSIAGGSGGNSFITNLYAVNRSWGEGTAGTGTGTGGAGQGSVSTQNNTSATWSHAFFNSQPWTTAGGDFSNSVSNSALVSGTVNSEVTWNSTPTMVSDIQTWLDNPTDNYGWILVGNESTASSLRSFYSREESMNAAFRPALEITFTAVPEPSAFALVIVAASAGYLRLRRHRDNKTLSNIGEECNTIQG